MLGVGCRQVDYALRVSRELHRLLPRAMTIVSDNGTAHLDCRSQWADDHNIAYQLVQAIRRRDLSDELLNETLFRSLAYTPRCSNLASRSQHD